MAAPGASGPLASSKRCPQCGALAGLNAPVCATCGRAFRGTIGQGAPPVVLPVASGPLPTPTAADADEVSAGNRNGALLVLLFVVGTVLMAVVASGLEKSSAPKARPAPPIPGVSRANQRLFPNGDEDGETRSRSGAPA